MTNRMTGDGLMTTITGEAGLPSAATAYTIVVVEELGVQALRHVLWIGGPPGTGKTAVATRIARRHGLRWYGTDTRTWQHRDRALGAGNMAARRWEAMTPEERWVQSTPAEMLDMSLHVERGPMVLDDLRALPDSPLLLAEGSTIPAHAVSNGIADRSRAVWLIPTFEFQRSLLAARGTPPGPTALYLLLRDKIAREASEHSVPTLILDGSLDLEAAVGAVEELFAKALAEGPRAETQAERRALLREANEAIAAQVRGYYARPWAVGDAESVVREFLCECGNTACNASVHAPVAAVMAEAVLAPGHR
jgi:hypothetical protein